MTIAFLACVASCSSNDAENANGLPAGRFSVTVLTTESELGEILAFNAQGLALTNGPVHHLAIIDTKARTFTQVSADGSPIGFDDVGDVLYRTANGVVMFRRANGAVEAVPLRIPGHGEFTPFALSASGVMWGDMYEEHEGQAGVPGYGAFANGVVTTFRTKTWPGVVYPEQYKPIAVNANGQVAFCKTQDGTEIAGNGFPKVECLIVHEDGSFVQLNDVYKGAFRAVPIRVLNARGEMAGQVDIGDLGLGGSRAFLYSPPTGNLLGEEAGGALALNDAGDVIYSQLNTPQHVLLRKANGQKSDLGGFLQHPGSASREINYLDILAMSTSGAILIRQYVSTTNAPPNVALLTPQ